MTPTYSTAFEDWHTAFDHWQTVAGMEIVDAYRKQARLIADRLIGGIGGAAGWNRATPPGNRAQGQGAEARDIRRAVFPLKAEGYYNVKLKKRIQAYVTAGNVPALQAMVQKGLFGQAEVQIHVLPAGNEYTAHQQSRIKGKVPKDEKRKFGTVGDSYLKQYIRSTKDQAGNAKGGWAAGCIALGGNPPQWITRHAKAGTFVDEMQPKREQLLFSIINRSKWAEDVSEGNRIVATVISDRAEAIQLDIENRLARSFRESKK